VDARKNPLHSVDVDATEDQESAKLELSGGGIKGGITHGATDELGYNAVEDIVPVHDLHATMLYLLGIDHLRMTYRYQGRDFRLTDVEGELIKKILA
jgi:hypothetical protein